MSIEPDPPVRRPPPGAARYVFRTGVALLLAVAAGAAAAGGEVTALRLQPLEAGDGVEAVVAGLAADGCTRELRSIERDGHELRVGMARAAATCLGEAQPFELTKALESPLEPGIYRLRAEIAAQPRALPRLEAFALVEVGEARAVNPEAGFWWGEAGGEFDHARPGFGVQLEVQGETLAVAVSGYDASGEPQWLFGAGTFSGRTARIALGRLRDGGGPFGEARSPALIEPAGQLHIEWQGSSRAVFWFEQPTADGLGIELRPMSLVRFGFAGQRQWQGRWLLAGETAADSAIAPRAIEFATVEQQPDRLVVRGTEGERLECTLAAQGNGLPAACTLGLGDDRRIEFDDVGFSRLRGGDAVLGQRAVLVRLDR